MLQKVNPYFQEDKDYIKRIVTLEEALALQYLNIEGAVKILQLYYTVSVTGRSRDLVTGGSRDLVTEGSCDLIPVPKSCDKTFEQEMITASSKVLWWSRYR